MKLVKLFVTSVSIALAFAPVHAQTNTLVRLQVPFGFIAGTQEMPAGDYTIEQTSESGVMMVRGQGVGHTVALLTMLVQAKSTDEPGAKFVTVQGQKYLNRVELTDGTARAIVMHSTK